jgi:hypothetical protein
MRTRVKALLAVMTMSVAFMASAKAAIFNTTPLNMFPSTLPGAQFTFISNSFSTAGTSFDDLWTFDMSQDGAVGTGRGSALATKIVGSTIDQVAIPFQLRLLAWDGVGYNLVMGDSGLNFTPTVQSPLPAHSGGAPGHGFYALEAIGTTPVGSVITQYSAQLQVAAVPEPSTYALVIGGMIVLAWQVRRRSI